MKNRYGNLIQIIDEIKPKTILEVGTHNGGNARKMILRAQKHLNSHLEKIIYYGFDLWEDLTPELKTKEHCGKCIATYNLAVENIATIHFCACEFIKGNTRDTLENFCAVRLPFVDFAFIDGGHSIETITSDWENIKQIMNPGGAVVFDDFYIWPPNKTDYSIGCNRVIDTIGLDQEHIITYLKPIDNDPNEIHKIHMVRVDIK